MSRPRRTKQPRVPRTRSTNGGDYTAVLLEELRGQMKVVIEALQECVTKREFNARFEAIDARFEAMDARFDAVDDALRGLRHDVDRSAQAASLHALEQRVTVLERRLGV